MLEAYTALGFVAGVTERLRLRVLVTGVTYRSPGILAKIVTTLDVLSGGRAELGIGAAWYEREHKFGRRGVCFTSPGLRLYPDDRRISRGESVSARLQTTFTAIERDPQTVGEFSFDGKFAGRARTRPDSGRLSARTFRKRILNTRCESRKSGIVLMTGQRGDAGIENTNAERAATISTNFPQRTPRPPVTIDRI
jgi:alkanesulfonate monooxygenase SsuD/methylene tetrahydromethanopterin reductase-like flavin-dependent oxidoreductase (luciferase family)